MIRLWLLNELGESLENEDEDFRCITKDSRIKNNNGRVDIDYSFRSITTSKTKLALLDACTAMENGEKCRKAGRNMERVGKQICKHALFWKIPWINWIEELRFQ